MRSYHDPGHQPVVTENAEQQMTNRKSDGQAGSRDCRFPGTCAASSEFGSGFVTMLSVQGCR